MTATWDDLDDAAIDELLEQDPVLQQLILERAVARIEAKDPEFARMMSAATARIGKVG